MKKVVYEYEYDESGKIKKLTITETEDKEQAVWPYPIIVPSWPNYPTYWSVTTPDDKPQKYSVTWTGSTP